MKKYLFWLLTFILIWLINFWYCSTVEDLITVIGSDTVVLNRWEYATLVHMSSASDYWTYCIKLSSWVNWTQLAIWFNSSLSFTQNWWYNIYNWYVWKYLCIYSDLDYIFIYNNSQTNDITISYDLFKLNVLFDTDIPRMTSLECQRNYWLMPIDDVNQNFCLSNWLCPSSECSWGVSSWNNWSALYINEIQHQSAPIINIMIPEEFDWDYTVDSESFDLDVNWYNVDTEYIDWIIRTQNYKPTSEDFTNLVWMLAPYSKYLIFLVFIFIIWAWLKKPFKSKKL